MENKVGSDRLRFLGLLLLGAFALAGGTMAGKVATQSGNEEPWLSGAFVSDTKAILRAAMALKVEEGTDIVVLLDERSFVYAEDGRKTRTRRQVYRVVTPAGAENWSDVEYQWEPWHQERPQVRARVITSDGSVHTLDPKTLSDAEVGKEQGRIYSDRHTLHGPLPAVASGSIVEEEAVIRDTAPFFERGEVVRNPFGRSVPVRRTRLMVDAPARLPLRYEIQLLPGLQPVRGESGGRVRLMFEQGPMPPLDDVPDYLPGEEPRYPNVTFSTGPSWQAVAARYAEQVEAQIRDADPRMLLGNVTVGPRQNVDVVGRLVARLHAQVRYTGVEFGEAALVPRTPAEVLQRKYGDCKDKSALLVAMLRAAGRPAYLALLLTAPSHDIDPGLPGLGRFDHAIVYLPGNPPLWIDATDDYAQPGVLPASAQGRLALIVSPETKELVRTAETRSAENRVIENREFFLADMGPARVVETTEVSGTIESFYRSSYAETDSKDARETLARYAAGVYLSDAAPKLDYSDVHDFSRPFTLRLEMPQARRGFTDLAEAVAAIPVADITTRLPYELRNAEEKAAEKPKRTADWVLGEASVSEWRYRIHPPAGFHVSSLPKGKQTQMGPASLTEEFNEEADGCVTAAITFDSGNRRFPAAQGDELRDGILALNKEDALIIKFAHRGFELLEAGKTQEALAEFRKLASADPSLAIHHVRMARGFLEAGLGEAARVEARRATEADPKSALCWKTLGWILQHDMLGRRFGKGFDHGGAVAAYRKAVELDPKDHEAAGDMAILLEHNSLGERYGAGAALNDAIDAYLGMKDELKGTDLANNLALAYLRAGRLKECDDWIKAMPATQFRRTLQLLLTAQREGASACIRQAAREISEEDARRTALRNVAAELIQMREYAQGGELLSSAARGAENAAQILGQAQLFSKMARYEDMKLSEDDPKTVVKRFFAVLLSPNSIKTDLLPFAGMLAAEHLADPASDEEWAAMVRGFRAMVLRGGLPLSVARDVVLNTVEMSQDGDSETAFRIRMQFPGANLTALVMRENGAYRFIDVLESPTCVGKQLLELIGRNDLGTARRILEWLREDMTPAGGDDPYAGRAFPRLWERGQTAERDAMRVAAASLISAPKDSQTAIEILREARQKPSRESVRIGIDTALAAAYSRTDDYENLLSVSAALLRSAPRSEMAFDLTIRAQLQLKRWNDAATTIAGRLKLLPDDRTALRARVQLEEWQGQFDKAVNELKSLGSSSRAEAGDWNNLAWDALFMDQLPPDAIAIAQRSATASQNNEPAILHTLASVLAAGGRAGEARSLMLQIMAMQGLEEPDSSIWLLYGLIAEEYGEKEIASAAFGKTRLSKGEEGTPNSSYELAQRHLKRLARAATAK